MRELLEMAGFEVILLEYWLEFGTIHAEDMDDYFEIIRRSSNNDSRNQGGELVYTSLIVDGVKKYGGSWAEDSERCRAPMC